MTLKGQINQLRILGWIFWGENRQFYACLPMTLQCGALHHSTLAWPDYF